MSTDHFAQLFPAVCAGFGLFLAGVANLLLLRRGLAVRAAATLAAAGVAVGGVWALDQPGAVSATAGYIAAGLGVCSLLASRRLVAGVASAVTATNRPVVRFGVLTVAGLGTIIGALAYFELADEQVADQMMAELELMQGQVPSAPSQRVRAITDKGRPIVLKEPTSAQPDAAFGSAEEKVLANAQLNEQVIRRGAADPRSNCHGWVFTGGKFILGGNDVDMILQENGYQEVVEPQRGDVVVYRLGGAVTHTALVRYVTEGQPVLVESKWGSLGVFLHPADKSVYGTEYTFHRSARIGHLLAGLGGQPGSPDARHPASAE